MEWVSVKQQPPPTNEPVVYRRPNSRKKGSWHVGIAYWAVSERWNPEAESIQNPEGFTHWMSLPLIDE